MKLIKILNKYPKLKKAGAVEVKTTNTKEKVLVAKKYDQYTGEVVGQKTYSLTKKDVQNQIDELREKIDSLQELKSDLK